jgi:DNA-binding MarR family transcriptional regulator
MPAHRPLPESVEGLIATRIESLEAMQVLFLLRDRPDRTFTAREVAESLALDDVSVSRQLIQLRQRGLLAVEMSDDASYRYAASGELASAVDELRECYVSRPLDLAALIANRPQVRLRLFADAFRLRGGK